MTDSAELLSGVSPVLEVPFDATEKVDADDFANVVHHVLAAGATSVMFPGFASEFHKLTDAERQRLRDILLAQTRDRDDVAAIISVPDHATAIAVDTARAAVEAGADAINILPPHLLGPTPSSIAEHIEAVLDAIRPVPAIVQYAPAQTGASLTGSMLAGLARNHPNLRRVKVESTPPGTMITSLLGSDPALSSFVGYGGLQLPDALRRGAVGVQPGCSFVELYLRIWHDWHTGDTHSSVGLHRRLLPYLAYWMQSVELILAAEKAISYRRGLIRASICRRPGYLLDSHELTMIDTFLAEFADELPEIR